MVTALRGAGEGAPGTVTAIVTVVLALAVVLAIATLGSALLALVPERSRCPRCGEAPLPLVPPAPLRAAGLERCWCFACGWSAIVRRPVCAESVGAAESSGLAATQCDGENEAWRPSAGDDGWTPDRGRDWS